jgi:hypothetical protein
MMPYLGAMTYSVESYNNFRGTGYGGNPQGQKSGFSSTKNLNTKS